MVRGEKGPARGLARRLVASAIVRLLGPLSAILAIILAWEGIVRAVGVPEYLVPAPSRILEAMWTHRHLLGADLLTTAIEAALGFLIANSASLLVVTVFYYSRIAERSVFPLFVALKSVPIVALAPLLVLWLGYGPSSKVAMAALVAFFPLVVGGMTGIRSFPPELGDLMRSLGATRWEFLLKVCFPSAVPHVLAALKVSCTLSVVGAIVGELTGAQRGLGFTILMATYNVDTPRLFCAIVLSAFLGLAFYASVLCLELTLSQYAQDEAYV